MARDITEGSFIILHSRYHHNSLIYPLSLSTPFLKTLSCICLKPTAFREFSPVGCPDIAVLDQFQTGVHAFACFFMGLTLFLLLEIVELFQEGVEVGVRLGSGE